MKCRVCGREIVIVRDGDAERVYPARAYHAGVNLHDRDVFSVAARVVEVSDSTAARLRRAVETGCLRSD